MSVEIIAGVVLGHLSAGVGKVALAPAEAYAEHWKERIKSRLDRTRAAGELKSDGEPFDVDDRVAFKALSEAAFNDDELIADYLGGVLAASGEGDDSGVSIVSQIARLSAAQLRFHYLVYRELRRLWDPETKLNLYQQNEAKSAGVRFMLTDLVPVLGERRMHLGSIIPVLAKEGLLNDTWNVGLEQKKALTVRVQPSSQGAELFLWGHGVKPVNANRLFEPDLPLPMLTELPPTPRCTLQSESLDEILARFPELIVQDEESNEVE